MKTPLQAAQDIAQLINSRPVSPRVDEMEAIIAGATTPQPACAHADPLGPVTQELTAAFFAWDRARIRPSEELDDHEARARQDIIAEKTAALFAIGVRSFADVRLLMPVVAYWNSPGSVKSPDYPECVLELGGEDEGEGFEPKSVAYLVRGLIGLLGMGGVASSIPVHARQDDPTLAALEQKLAEVIRHYEVARVPAEEKDWLPLRDKADDADSDLAALSRRIFAARPITLHNLKLRALIAKHWQGLGDQGEKWTVPEQCTDWESEVYAHLIDGVLRFDTPPDRQSFEPVALPSPELATFRSAMAGAAEFRRANPEPDVGGPGYDAWCEQHGERLDGVWKVAEGILAGKAPPLDVLNAIATHYILDDHPELIASAADGDAHDSMATWIVARLLHVVQPSIQPKAGE